MVDKLKEMVTRYEEMGIRLNDPSVIADQEQWQKLMKEHASLQPLVETYQAYEKALDQEQEALGLL